MRRVTFFLSLVAQQSKQIGNAPSLKAMPIAICVTQKKYERNEVMWLKSENEVEFLKSGKREQQRQEMHEI